jgi:plasmid maintenance system killer protein
MCFWLFGLFSLGLHLFDKAHEDTVETLLVNRGNRFDIHYDNSWLSQSEHSLWVNGKYVLIVGMVNTETADLSIKEYVISFSPDEYEPYTSIMSYLHQR